MSFVYSELFPEEPVPAFINVFKNLLTSARLLRGNARACVIVEPIWAVPQIIALTFQSLYFVGLGCSPEQIGIITAVGMASQFVCALISGYITDRLGRRRTTIIFDLLGWTLALILFAVSRNIWGLLLAAVVNGGFRIATTAHSCVLIEDTPPEHRAHAYTWLQVASIAAGFFAPLGGLLVARLTIVPAERILLVVAGLSMVIMTTTRFRLLRETPISLRMMEVSKTQKLSELAKGYLRSLKRLGADKLLLSALILQIGRAHV
jgi:MFS transporter, DHA1 family, tetracycline resistance protein